MRLHLGGYLNTFDRRNRTDLIVEVQGRQHLKDVLDGLAIPAAEIFLVSVNGEVVALDNAWVLSDDDVKVYPPMGGG